MKANGAPEKLYLLPNGLISYRRNTDEDVEFTCTDTFIERACEYLMDYEFNDSPNIADRRKRVDKFRNYMKGE